MNLKSFILKTEKGIFTVTNLQPIKKVVYKPRATMRDNRWGEICYQGYGDKEKYIYSSDLSEVYQYVLVAKHGSNETVITVLSSEEEGQHIMGYIWDTIVHNPKLRMVDLTYYRPNWVAKQPIYEDQC